MSRLRVLYQLLREGDDVSDLLDHTAAARMQPGCDEAECYRGFEFPEHVAVVELWVDEFAYSGHWRDLLESGEAFDTILRSSPPADQSVGEFYRHQYHANKDGVWTPPEYAQESSVILWPGGAQVRIIGQNTRELSPDTLPQLVAWSEETRKEPGCLQFETLQSFEPEAEMDTLTLELWTDQIIYDRHWALRRRSVAAGAARASGGPRNVARPERRLGTNGFEFYQCGRFTHLYDHWHPENVACWSETVRWMEA